MPKLLAIGSLALVVLSAKGGWERKSMPLLENPSRQLGGFFVPKLLAIGSLALVVLSAKGGWESKSMPLLENPWLQ